MIKDIIIYLERKHKREADISSGTSAGHVLSSRNWLARRNMVKKNIEDDEEDDLIEFVAPVAMDWVKDQHVERLHPNIG
jgi:hypothetical protein